MGFFDDVGNYLFGGNATKGLNAQGQYGQQLGGYYQNALGGVGNPALNFGQANADRQRMGYLADQLNGVASGQQKGAGELATERQVSNATAAQQAAANAARGANAALAMRNAARNAAQLGVAGAGQAQQAALQDQANARGQLAGVLGQMQGGDLSQQQLALQQYQAQNAARLGYLQGYGNLNQQGVQNQIGINQLGMQDKGIFPYLLQGAGSYLAGGFGRGGGGGAPAPAPAPQGFYGGWGSGPGTSIGTGFLGGALGGVGG